MSKLRIAVSKVRLSLAQDVEPAPDVERVPALAQEAQEEQTATLRRLPRKRRARVPIGSDQPANGNGGDKEEEPQAIRDARVRLRTLIAAATKDAPKPSVGIVLAIVNQETGNHAAANALIDELGLEKLFGIKKFC